VRSFGETSSSHCSGVFVTLDILVHSVQEMLG
jgi:hypothetical protein